jgi:8-oxo-dGTP pyrophosphatase MutT (NUDIX family)
MNDAVPAATVLLLRDAAVGVEVLMLRRSREGAFADTWVFPGGKVDPVDRDPSDGTDDEVAAARRAAVRETLEEAGVLVRTDDLVTFSHWMPPVSWKQRFSTWFFVARAPDEHEVLVDGLEIHEHEWMRPADAIARRDAGELILVPPTWVTLWTLSTVPSVDAVLEEARKRDPVRYETRPATVGAATYALWAGDAGYDDGDVDRPGARHRLLMLPDGWRFELTV